MSFCAGSIIWLLSSYSFRHGEFVARTQKPENCLKIADKAETLNQFANKRSLNLTRIANWARNTPQNSTPSMGIARSKQFFCPENGFKSSMVASMVVCCDQIRNLAHALGRRSKESSVLFTQSCQLRSEITLRRMNRFS